MNIEQQVADAQALIKLHIDELAQHHQKCIESDFAIARIESDRRWRPTITINGPMGRSAGVSWFDSVGKTAKAFEFRTPSALLYRSDPIYINVPEILAIWLRSTTPYRVARRIWVGEKAD